MATTFCQIYAHIVFSVRSRKRLIPPEHKEELHKYITGIVQQKGQKMIAINSMPDHIHLFIGFTTSVLSSDLVRDIKVASTRLINERGWVEGGFHWQSGFGIFTYSRSQIPAVAQYIQNQERHHAARSFKSEYRRILQSYDVEFDERYLVDWDDDDE